VKEISDYDVSYGKAWRAREIARGMVYGDWCEAYERLPALFAAIKDRNPSMVYQIEHHKERFAMVDHVRRPVFDRAFWCFGQCVEAFKHCRPVLSVDGTFLAGKFKGTMLTAIGADGEGQLLPLAFAIVEKEDKRNWEWFMRLVRTILIGPQREVCIVSDRHIGIMNAMGQHIEGHAPLHHRWCMRHFAANFHSAGGTKDQTEYLRTICMIEEQAIFWKELEKLKLLLEGGPRNWLEDQLVEKHKWARAFDTEWRRYGIMTSNMAEVFNNVLKGIRALPVTAIVMFTFEKLNEYFVDRLAKYVKLRDENKQKWGNNVLTKLKKANKRASYQSAKCFDKATKNMRF
jgi:transposase-like protein